MRLGLASFLAATALLLAACSSGDTQPAASPSTGPESPEPSSTALPTDPSDEAFCSALVDFSDAHDTIFLTNIETLGSLLPPYVDPSNSAALDAVHTISASFLTAADDADAASGIVIANTRDPDVAATVREANDVIVDFARWIGTTGRDTDDLVAFSEELTRRYNEVWDYVVTVDRENLDAYAAEACADLYQDTTVQADVSVLGYEIALYYLDNENGPDPIITVADGHYYLLDTDIGMQWSNAVLTDQYYNGSTDWCVEVTSDHGSGKTFKYSAADGLREGTCR